MASFSDNSLMKLAVFSAHPYDKRSFDAAYRRKLNIKIANGYSTPSNPGRAPDALFQESEQNGNPLSPARDMTNPTQPFQIIYHDFPLSPDTVALASGCQAICAFVNDILSADVLHGLYSHGTRAILLRCAGYNNIDLVEASKLGFFVANVPAYSPEAVAEFAVALIQTLNRRTHRAYNRVREGNFSLNGLLGVTLKSKAVGIVGIGKIGLALARILRGFGCRLFAFDPWGSKEFEELGGRFVEMDTLLAESDIVSLHCPLMDSTRHLINATSLSKMKQGAMLVNTSRGGLIDTKACIESLKSGHLGSLALDVYEAEGSLFYNDHSDDIIQDDDLTRLMTFPNTLVCGHQAFFTEEALMEISEVTLGNMEDFMLARVCMNSLVGSRGKLMRRDSKPVRNV